jgi:hypothetical protein
MISTPSGMAASDAADSEVTTATGPTAASCAARMVRRSMHSINRRRDAADTCGLRRCFARVRRLSGMRTWMVMVSPRGRLATRSPS